MTGPYDHSVAEIDALSDGERGWIRANLAALAQAGVDVHDPRSLGLHYDQEFLAWSATSASRRPDPNPIINMIGIGLGECLNGLIGTSWAVATDEHGTEVVIHRPANNVILYPPNAVAKRWSDGDVDFIPGFVRQIVDRLATL